MMPDEYVTVPIVHHLNLYSHFDFSELSLLPHHAVYCEAHHVYRNLWEAPFPQETQSRGYM